MEFPWDLAFVLGIFKGCHTILQNFHGKLVLPKISKGKTTNLKIPGWDFNKVFPQTPSPLPPPAWIFFWNSPFSAFKGATKLLPKLIFVSATQIRKNTKT